MKKTFKWTRIALTLGIVAIIALSAYAFTNNNVVPGSYAGDGSQTISGYTVSNIAYSLNNATPTNLDAVSFTLDAAAGTVKIKVVGGGSWYSCSNTGGNNWSCDTTSPQATVQAANNLEALAVQ
jgi:hypothetical protein